MAGDLALQAVHVPSQGPDVADELLGDPGHGALNAGETLF